jgi:hypothetical protein
MRKVALRGTEIASIEEPDYFKPLETRCEECEANERETMPHETEELIVLIEKSFQNKGPTLIGFGFIEPD